MRIISWFRAKQIAKRNMLSKDVEELSLQIAKNCKLDYPSGEEFAIRIGSAFVTSRYEKDVVLIIPDGRIYILTNKDDYRLMNPREIDSHILSELRSAMIEYVSPSRERPS